MRLSHRYVRSLDEYKHYHAHGALPPRKWITLAQIKQEWAQSDSTQTFEQWRMFANTQGWTDWALLKESLSDAVLRALAWCAVGVAGIAANRIGAAIKNGKLVKRES